MSELPGLAKADPVPAPVIALHPDGVVLRTCDAGYHWLTIRRDGRTGSEQRLTDDELRDVVLKGAARLGMVVR